MRRLMTAIGLCVALVGPPLIAAITPQFLRALSPTASALIGQLLLWSLGGLIIIITLYGEQRSLASLGLRRPSLRSLFFGICTAFLLLYIVSPFGAWLVATLSLPGFESGLSKLQDLPSGILLLGALTAGLVEELMYRGYAIERLAWLTGNRVWLGALLALFSFAFAHLPFWGLGSVLFTLIGGSVLTLLYVWRRDLAANMLAHTLTAVLQMMAVVNSTI